MGIEMEGLEFQIETKAEQGVKGVDALTASLGKLKSATKGGLGLGSSVKQLEKLDKALSGFHTEKLESLGRALESVSKLGEVKISGSIAKQLGGIADVMDRITLSDIERLEDMGKALRELGELSDIKIPKVTVPKTGVVPGGTPTTPGTTPITPATSGVEQVAPGVQQAGQAVEQVTAKTNVLKRVLSGIGGVFSKGFSLGAGALHKLGNALTKVQVAGTKAKDVLGRIKDMLGSALAAKVKQNTSGLGKLYNSIKRIAMYRLIRFALSALTKALKEGINNLYQYSNLMGGTFAQSMDRLATSSSYLKNSLGAMAAPIINALAPAIDFVIDKVVALLNVINMLFARLSGASTFTAAKKNAQSYGDSLAGAGGSAAKAAKEIRDATTGIDELNIIMQKDNTGGGGGGAGTDYGSMFEELPIDNSVSEFADKLKQAFDNADWKTLGTLIGGKVNELIDSIDYAAVGSKLGWGINGAVQTAYYFLDTVNFTNIGTHIAELLNAGIEQIDWNIVGRGFIKLHTLLPDIIIGIITEIDWALIGRSIGNFIIGAFDEATEWFRKYDWSQLGSDLWQALKDLIVNIDWAGIATSIFTFLGTAIRSAVQFLGSFFGNIGSDIKTWWDNEIAGEDWKQTGLNLLNFIGEGLADIGNWCMTNIIDPFCNALLGEEKWASIKQAGADMWAGFTKGLTEFFADPGGWIKTNIVDPFVQWFKDLFGIHSPSTVMEEIGGYITEGLLNGILKPFKAIGTWVKKNILDPLTEVFEDFDLVEFTVGVKNTAAEWWSNVCTWWDEKVGAVQSFTTNVVNHATTWWNNTKTWWSGKVSKVKEFTTSVTNQATEWWSKVNTWWDGKVGAVKQFTTTVTNQASTWWSNVKTWWSGKVGAVENFTTNVVNQSFTWWNNVKTWWSGRVGAVKEFTTTVTNQSIVWWSNVKTWWSGKVGAVQQFTTSVKNEASTWWSNVKTWWSGKVGAVQQFTTSLKNDSFTWWSNCKTWWSGKVGAVQSFTTSVKNEAYTWWSNVRTWWSGVVGNLSVGVAIKNQASTWWSNVKTWWGNVVGDLVTTLRIKVPKISIKWSSTTVFGKEFNYPSGFNVTWNAKGAILDGAQLFGMLGGGHFLGGGEAGKEAVLPLETHTEWMDTLADKVRSGLPEDVDDSPGYAGFKRAMADFYMEYVQGTMNQMADDMNRQANKKEQTNVQIGNRTITDAVKTQRDADGYSFT